MGRTITFKWKYYILLYNIILYRIEKLSSNLHDKFIAAVESGFMISSYKGELYKLKKK